MYEGGSRRHGVAKFEMLCFNQATSFENHNKYD